MLVQSVKVASGLAVADCEPVQVAQLKVDELMNAIARTPGQFGWPESVKAMRARRSR